jgi:hypothetical protein
MTDVINIIIPSSGKFQLNFPYRYYTITTPTYNYETFNNKIIIDIKNNRYLQYVAHKYFNYNMQNINFFEKIIQNKILLKINNSSFIDHFNMNYSDYDSVYDSDSDSDPNYEYVFVSCQYNNANLIKSDIVLEKSFNNYSI